MSGKMLIVTTGNMKKLNRYDRQKDSPREGRGKDDERGEISRISFSENPYEQEAQHVCR